MSRIDPLRISGDPCGIVGACVLDPATSRDQHAVGNYAAVGEDRSVVEDLGIGIHLLINIVSNRKNRILS